MSPAKPATAHVAVAVNPTALKPLRTSVCVHDKDLLGKSRGFYFQETNKKRCHAHVAAVA